MSRLGHAVLAETCTRRSGRDVLFNGEWERIGRPDVKCTRWPQTCPNLARNTVGSPRTDDAILRHTSKEAHRGSTRIRTETPHTSLLNASNRRLRGSGPSASPGTHRYTPVQPPVTFDNGHLTTFRTSTPRTGWAGPDGQPGARGMHGTRHARPIQY